MVKWIRKRTTDPEVGSSNPCEYQKINCKEEGKSEVIWGVRWEVVKWGVRNN